MKKPSKDSVVKIPNKATSQYMPTESQLRALRFVKISGDKNCYNYELRKFGFYYWGDQNGKWKIDGTQVYPRNLEDLRIIIRILSSK